MAVDPQPEAIPTGFSGKRLLFGLSGSIGAFKAASWVRRLGREGARVQVVMTRSARRFISPLTLGALSGNRVFTEMFSEEPEHIMAHVTVPREVDAVLVAPATAQTISRLAQGQADDLLAAMVLAARVPILVCPAMNTNMLDHPATQDNLSRLRGFGYQVVEPASGLLACGDEGAGRLPPWEEVREHLLALFCPQDLAGRTVLVTAGPTREMLDPVRFLGNRSSGRMGFALARTARRRGARVVLISGPVCLEDPPGVEVIRVTTARQMHRAVLEHYGRADVVVMAAAVADFTPQVCRKHKIKKGDGPPSLELQPTTDILADLGQRRRPGQVLIGFAAESRAHEVEGRRKLAAKQVDLMVVNDILGDKTGFEVETNQVLLLDQQGRHQLPLLSKEATANGIWDRAVKLLPHCSGGASAR